MESVQKPRSERVPTRARFGEALEAVEARADDNCGVALRGRKCCRAGTAELRAVSDGKRVGRHQYESCALCSIRRFFLMPDSRRRTK